MAVDEPPRDARNLGSSHERGRRIDDYDKKAREDHRLFSARNVG
jgi:hypothetical protein